MKKIISTTKAPKAIGPYNQAVQINGFLFVSGQIAINPETNQVIEGGIKEQTEQVLKNIGAILEAAGYTYKDVVKATVLLADINDFKAMNEVYSKFFGEESPAREAYQVAALPLGVKVEISVIAAK